MSNARTKRLNESQNPVINGGIASEFQKIILPQNSTANLASISQQNVGSLAFDTTLNKVVVSDGSSFSPVAPAGGSGANTNLSNLTAPTAVNKDLIFNTGSTVVIKTKDDNTTFTRDLDIKTGEATGFQSGSISIFSGSTDTTKTGAIDISSSSGAGNTPSGDVAIHSGDSQDTTSGNISLASGETQGSGNSGSASVLSGITVDGNSGSLNFQSGSSTGAGVTGDVTFASGNATDGNTGGANILTGSSNSANTGQLTLATGQLTASGASSGPVSISSGQTVDGDSGPINLASGDSVGIGNSGDINLSAGAGALRGKVHLDARLVQMPVGSSDPASPSNGSMYYNTGTNKLRLFAAGVWVDLN